MNRAERRRAAPSPQSTRQGGARRKAIIIYGSIAVVAIIVIVAIALASRTPQTASLAPSMAHISVGQQAPEFSVSTTSGPFDLAKGGGHPTFLEVFATWCPHCQHEASIINGLYSRFHNGSNFVAVSGSPYAIDGSSNETQADVMGFVQKFNVKYPVAFDPNLTVANAYLQGGYPTIVLIGADQKILAIGSGELAASDLQKALQNAVDGKPVDPTFGVH